MSSVGLAHTYPHHRSKKRFDGVVTLPGARTSTGADLDFDVVSFGRGRQILVIVPGLGDGLASVAGQSWLLSRYYRRLVPSFRVYVISRPRRLPMGYETRAMAADYAALFHRLEFPRGCIDLWGLSQGGMIAQWIGIEHGAALRRLCVTVSASRPTSTLRRVVEGWMDMARAGRYRELARDTMRKTYSPHKLRRYAPIMPFLGLLVRPKNLDRFLIQAKSCLTHSAYRELPRVRAPTLIIGGAQDQVVGPNTSEEMAEQIPNAQLKVYPDLGHGAYEEAQDCTADVMNFFTPSSRHPDEHGRS